MPDIFPQTQLSKAILVMILSAASDKTCNSGQLMKRKRTLVLKTEEIQRELLLQVWFDPESIPTAGEEGVFLKSR